MTSSHAVRVSGDFGGERQKSYIFDLLHVDTVPWSVKMINNEKQTCSDRSSSQYLPWIPPTLAPSLPGAYQCVSTPCATKFLFPLQGSQPFMCLQDRCANQMFLHWGERATDSRAVFVSFPSIAPLCGLGLGRRIPTSPHLFLFRAGFLPKVESSKPFLAAW